MDARNGVMPLQDIKRMAHVKRWQIVQVNREQTLAEHSALVALYALELFNRLVKKPSHQQSNWCNFKYDILLWGLVHDAPEVYTGDICALSKEAIGPEGLKGLEILERNTGPAYAEVADRPHYIVQGVVKLADFLEALVFMRSAEPVNRTNHYISVYAGLEERYMVHGLHFLETLRFNGVSNIEGGPAMEKAFLHNFQAEAQA